MENKATCVPYIRGKFDNSTPEDSIRTLASALFAEWHSGRELKITRLTQGTTNSLFKVELYRRSVPDSNSSSEVVLIKVYGGGTETTVDRHKELRFHALLADNQFAPALLARFDNGHAYLFVQGEVCPLRDLSTERIWRGVARELARWHTVLPVPGSTSEHHQPAHNSFLPQALLDIQPNVWVTAQKWLRAIPSDSVLTLKKSLEKEFEYLVQRLVMNGNLEASDLVLGHGDLLCGNIIILDRRSAKWTTPEGTETVKFIDYEHSTYCPVAFELANHFAEWAGFECDYNLLPTKSIRHNFIREYVRTRRQLVQDGCTRVESSHEGNLDDEAAASRLMVEVDNYRGFPGFYWGLCALIQAGAATGAIDFDYAGYAKLRLAEYWAWREEDDGSRIKLGKEISLREKRWAAKN